MLGAKCGYRKVKSRQTSFSNNIGRVNILKIYPVAKHLKVVDTK
jgi:hypothetical protein